MFIHIFVNVIKADAKQNPTRENKNNETKKLNPVFVWGEHKLSQNDILSAQFFVVALFLILSLQWRR